MSRVWLSCLLFLVACPTSTPVPEPTPPPKDAGVKSAAEEIFEARPESELPGVEDAPAPKDAEALLQAFGAAEQAADAGDALTPDQLKAALLATATCDVVAESGEVAAKCKPMLLVRAQHLKAAPDKDARARLAAAASEHLSHPRAATRAAAVLWHTDRVGATPEHRARLLRLAGRERHAQPLGAYVRALRPYIADDPKVASFILKASEHSGAYARRNAALALAGAGAAKVPGALERVEALILRDKDLRVRTKACERLGSRGDDDRVLAIIETFVDAPTRDPKMYAACLRGLIGAWTGPVPPKKPSKAAYEKTLEVLKRTPRSHGIPDFRALLRLQWANSEAARKAAPFLSPQDLRAGLTEVIADDAVGWIGRVALVDILQKVGASKDELTRLRDGLKKGEDLKKRRHVIRKLDDVLSKM